MACMFWAMMSGGLHPTAWMYIDHNELNFQVIGLEYEQS